VLYATRDYFENWNSRTWLVTVKLSWKSKAIFDFWFETESQQRLGYKGFGSSRPIYRLPKKTKRTSGQPQSRFDPSKNSAKS
jgi:hypothetical protein